MSRDASQIREELAVQIRETRAELRRLQKAYKALTPPPAPKPSAPATKRRKGRRVITEPMVRDAIIALDKRHPGDSFAMADVFRELDCAENNRIRSMIRGFTVPDGMLEVVKNKRSRPRFRYVPPKATASAVEKERRKKAAAMLGVTSDPIPGTGKPSRPSRADVTAVLNEARGLGFNVQRTKGGHWRAKLGRQGMVIVPSSPSDPRALDNVRAQMRKLVTANASA